MISKKELEYVNVLANKVPYPGREYCEEAMDKLVEGIQLYDTRYANLKYNISDAYEVIIAVK